ncbi:MAG: hypothetical protein KDK89_07505 [Alphaproteobacteria bacterium]|nr:hypothetical protein [Alphaproteobacteria bacterium]
MKTLSRIEDHDERLRETLDYLATLPPWPEPLPDAMQPPPADQQEMLFDDEEPVTVTALLEAQDLAGWRFSPIHGSLVLYVQDLPTDARQAQLAKMAADRAAHLLLKLGDRINQGGLRQDVAEETQRFSDILADDSRPLSIRSIELWGSLVALGSQLEENDQGRRDGRDPLDLLTNEARASLQTFLGIAAGLVRSFPEARKLDDDHGTFDRRGVTIDMLLEVFEAALNAAFIDERSAALVQHVAEIAQDGGKQALKAESVTVSGSKNLVLTAALVGGLAGGVTTGVLGDIGTDISNHYELGEKAIAFIEGSKDQINDLLDQLTPDERARLRSALKDALKKAGRGTPGTGPQ